MKCVKYLSFFVIVGCLTNCTSGPDPIEPKNTFEIDNRTVDDIKVVYTISEEYVYWEQRKISFTDSCVANAYKSTQLPIDKYGIQAYYPSQLFKSVMLLSLKGDTLQVLSPVDDSLWNYSESVSYYGYKVTNSHWKYIYNY